MTLELQALDSLARRITDARDFFDLAMALGEHFPPLSPCDSLAMAFVQAGGTSLRVGPSECGAPTALATGDVLELDPDAFEWLFRPEKIPVLVTLETPPNGQPFCAAFREAYHRGYGAALIMPLFDRARRPAGAFLLFADEPDAYDGVPSHAVSLAGSMLEGFLEQARRDGRLAASNAVRERLVERTDRLTAAAQAAHKNLVGESPAWRALYTQLDTAAPLDVTVLILGETGTGKEAVARALHRRSPRAERPFVAVNCGAIAPTLAASELFGHEKGAFTGAERRRIGCFEAADGGTLFLDEVAELPPELQVQLLRVLQERHLTRVGGQLSVRVDVRIVAATHRDLDADRATGRFRDDLYYRLNVLPLRVPPLRERPEDLPLLLTHFLERSARKLGRRFEAIGPGVLERCAAYAWPGNIRELENLVERHAVLCEGPVFFMDPQPEAEARSQARRDAQTFSDVVREHLTEVLARTGGRLYGKGGAAEILGMKPTTLASKLKKLGIDRRGH